MLSRYVPGILTLFLGACGTAKSGVDARAEQASDARSGTASEVRVDAGTTRDAAPMDAAADRTSVARDAGAAPVVTSDAGVPSFPQGITRPSWWTRPVPAPDLTPGPKPDFAHHGFA